MKKNDPTVRLVEVPEGTPEAPPIHGVYAEYLSLIPRLRYPPVESAWLLAISERQLSYRVEAGEIQPVFDGNNNPLFTIQELKRYASRSHSSMKRPPKKRAK